MNVYMHFKNPDRGNIDLTFKSFCNSIRIKSADAEMKYPYCESTCCKYFKLKQFILEKKSFFF